MRNKKILFVLLLALSGLGFNWGTFSIRKKTRLPIKIQSVWTVDTIQEGILRPQTVLNSPPLVAKSIVVQGNFLNGIKAYKKNTGKLKWHFKIRSGVASPVILHKGDLYFGGADGFFYSLQLETGQLNWKFWTGSENLSSPLIHEDKVYWTTNNQKLYALSLQGKQLWIYSGPSPSKNFIVRGRPRPAVYKNLIYAAFYPGHLVALDKKSGKLKWKLNLSLSHSIKEDLRISGNCLLVPVFDFYLFCLQPLDKRILWKARGGASSHLAGNSVVYQFYKDTFYALKSFNGKSIWEKKMKTDTFPLPAVAFKDYLVYGFSSKGKLVFADVKNGQTLTEYKFGRGLAAPVSVGEENKDIYFFSVDGYLHKVSIL